MSDLTPRPEVQPPTVPGRSCDGCTACCKLVAVRELQKPAQQWCQHCDIGKGCRIYEQRPADCRTFVCGWLGDDRVGEEWRPRDTRMVIKFEGTRIIVHVDKDRRDAWRREPFHSQIRAWARNGLAHNGEVIVYEGKDALRIHPAGEEKL